MLLVLVNGRGLASGHKPIPYRAKAATLNLKTGDFKEIGDFEGGFTFATAVPHASSDVKWISREDAEKGADSESSIVSVTMLFGGNVGLVDEESHELLDMVKKH